LPTTKSRSQLETPAGQINLGAGEEKLENGLARLVLTVVEVLRQVLEKQALRRADSGSLTEEEVERLGLAFMQLNRRLVEISREFGVKPEELKAGLGALVRTGNRDLDRVSLADLIQKLLEKGVVAAGRVRIAVSDIDLVGLDLLAVLYPIHGERRGAAKGAGGRR
jgi:hypothetical protein